MRPLVCAAILLVHLSSARALTAPEDLIEQLATCRASWLDWKNDPAQAQKFRETITARFTQQSRGPAWTPKQSVTLLGMPVVEAFPESVGMGVGFSMTVDAPLEKARAQVEKITGRTFKTCERDGGMLSCLLEVADKRTLMLMSDDSAKSKHTLVGCYYLYAK